MIKQYKKYVIYGLSIIASRGLEYLVLFFAAKYLSKEHYGGLEFYKKTIELLAVGVAFGLPSLLLTYTKSSNSKVYFNVLSIVFITCLSLVLFPVLWGVNYLYLIIPVFFHAIFFNNGTIPVFFITTLGSNKASLYKIIVSAIFYIGVLLIILYHSEPEKAFITINYFLIIPGLIYAINLFRDHKVKWYIIKKYYKLFKKLIFSSFTLVVSNFTNIMFLYTDIMILKLISKTPNTDIADYSFVLNISNILVLIPLTMVQVDIEKIKKGKDIKRLRKHILLLLILLSAFISLIYLIIIKTHYTSYENTIYLFFIVLAAKFFQSTSVLYGSLLLIFRRFITSLKINVLMLVLNIVLSYVLFYNYGLYGIAFASFLSLVIRYLLLKYFSGETV